MKKRKTARETDAEFRMYEFNPPKCYCCNEPLVGSRLYKNLGDMMVCLLCLKTVREVGEGLGLR